MKKITLLMALFVAFGMNAQDVLLYEDFESGSFPPADWEVINTHPSPDSNWHEGDASLSGGDGLAAEALWTDAQLMDEWLISPSLDLTNYSNGQLSFDWMGSYTWMVENAGQDLFIKISTDGGTNWDQVWVEEEFGPFDNFIYNLDTTIDLSAYDGESDVIIAIHYLGDDGAQVQVDNIEYTAEESASLNDNNIAGFSQFYSTQNKNLNIAANDAFSNITMFNIAGQQVISKQLSSNNEVINLSSLTDGVYLANVTANGKSTTFKIVKK